MPFQKSLTMTVILLITIIFTCAWCPWISWTYAAEQTVNHFELEWKDTADGCGIDCADCGVKHTMKTWFGRNVLIEYSCGQISGPSAINKETKAYFVSFLGTVSWS